MTITAGGQSLQEYWFKRGTPRVAVDFAGWVQDAMEFTPNGRSFSTWSSGASVSDGSNEAATNYTVKVYNCASGGSSLWDSPTGAGLASDANYWWNLYGGNSAATGNALDDLPNSPGPLARAMAAILTLGTTDLILWDQGTTNALSITSGTLQSLYASTLTALFTYFRQQTGRTTPINITPIGNDNSASPAGHQRLRIAQLLVQSSMAKIHMLGQAYDLKYAIASVHTGANYSSGSAVVTMADTTGFAVNQIFESASAGIPDNTYILSVDSGTQVTLSANATANLVGGTVYRMDGVHKYPGGDGVQPLDTAGGTKHNETDGFYKIAKRIAYSIPRIYETAGKIVVGAQAVSVQAQGSNNYVDVNLTHDEGTDFSATDISTTGYMWRVAHTPFGGSETVYTPSAVSKVSSTKFRLTIGTTLTGGDAVGVTNIYGPFNRTSVLNYINDNATIPACIVPSSPETNAAMAITVSQGIPRNTVAPTVSGLATIGSTLTCATGTWTETPTSYSYQWKNNDSDIVGATNSTYVTVAGDNADTITCAVSATNAIGTSGATTSSNGILVGNSYVNSVQYVSITIPGGSNSATATISAVGSGAFLILNGHSTTDNVVTTLTRPAIRVTLTNSTTVTANRQSADATITTTVNVAVIDATANLVESVQFGTVAVNNATSNTATISSVDLSRSAVFYLGQSSTSTSAANRVFGAVELTNATTVTGVLGATASTTTCTLSYCVVQFAASAIQSVQRFATNSSSSSLTTAQAISAVTTANSMIAWGGVATSNSTFSSWIMNAQLTSTTNVNLVRTGTGAVSRTAYITVIDFASGVLSSMQRGTIALASVASNTATISAVGSKAVLNWLNQSTTATTPDEAFTTVTLTNSTTITANKNTAGTTTSTVSYEMMEFN